MNDGFYGEFLTELKALDDFMAQRRRSSRLVERDDPDVRRLMESLAFFSARTRESAADELRGSVHRLVHGHLDEFLTPQPTRGLLRAAAGARLTDPVRLPRGSRIRLRTMSDDVAMFTTMRDVTVRPLQLDWAELQVRGRRGYRVLIRIRSRTPASDLDEPLSLHVSHLGDYLASLRSFSRLRAHLQKAYVVYDEVPAPSDSVAEGSRYRECSFSFGSSRAAGEVADVGNRLYRGPTGMISAIREFFHFPRQELFLNLSLAPSPRPWREAWLCLDLDGDWPEDQVINESMFKLFVVPIENLFVEPAEPIGADGTRSAHPIRPASPEAHVSFHSVVEVSQETASGPDFILPAYLAGGQESYDIEYQGVDDPLLLLRLPGAFQQPRIVTVQARWYQPWLDEVAVGKVEASFQTRHIEGVDLELQGDLTPHKTSPLWRDATAMLQVLSRRSKRVLSRQDLVKLMWILGADDEGHHGGVASELLRVMVREEPANLRRGGGVMYVYGLTLANVEEEEAIALQEDYARCVGQLIDAWTSNPTALELRRRAVKGEVVASAAGGAG